MVIWVPAAAWPVTEPVALCASTGAASDERQTPIAMQSTDLRKLRVVLLMVSPRWCSWLWRGYEVVVPLVEVQVAAAPFGFAALQVHRLGAVVRLCRHEGTAVVVVEGDAVAVQAAQVEACDGRVGVVEPAEGHVHRH